MNKVKQETPTKKQKIKKVLKSVIALALVAVVSILGTLAYLSTLSNKKTNTFTATKDIKLWLDEKNFNETDAGNYMPETTYAKDPILYNIYCEGEANQEWVIMRIDYTLTTRKKVADTNGNYEIQDDTTTVKSLAEITAATENSDGLIETPVFDKANWIEVKSAWLDNTGTNKLYGPDNNKQTLQEYVNTQSCQYFVYKYPLTSIEAVNAKFDQNGNIQGTPKLPELDSATAGEGAAKSGAELDATDKTGQGCRTTPLFEQIKIKSQAQLETNGYKDMSLLPTFKIHVQGGAIKNVHVDIPGNKISCNSGENTNEPNDKETVLINELVKLLVNEDPST